MRKNFHIYTLLFVCFFLNMLNVKAQLSASPDTVRTCPLQTIQLTANLIPPNYIPLSVDDNFGPVQNLGFTFNYFGTPYTQCVVSGNNFLSFDVALANGYSSFVYGTALTSGNLNRAIMFPFQDTNPGVGGGPFRSVSFMFGNPGNRAYVVQFCQMPLFSCNTLLSSSQAVLYEGSDIIDIHILNKPAGCTWQGGTGIIGIKNMATEVLVPGRNLPNVNWGDASKSYRFTPNGTGGYDLDSFPYNPIKIVVEPDTNRLFWYAEGDTVNPIAIGQNVSVVASKDVNYFVVKYDGSGLCENADTVIFYDTVYVDFLNYTGNTAVEICQGATYNFYGETVYQSGVYQKMLQTTLGCDSLLSLNLTVNPLPVPVINEDRLVEICEGTTKKLELANPLPGATYRWFKDGVLSTESNTPEINITQDGRYYIEVTSDKGCVGISNIVEVRIRPNPIAEIVSVGEGEVGCTYDTVRISALFSADYDYKWWPETALRPYNDVMSGHEVYGVFRDERTPMKLTVRNEFGCFSETTFEVVAKPCCDVFIPNAFTPNGDNNNDIFTPILKPLQLIVSFEVFDRFGALVYRGGPNSKGWDGNYLNGKEAPTGVYMYQVIYSCDDGKNYTKKESISLLR